MIIAVEGCAHGELDRIYATLLASERHGGPHVDLLLCCGDFQAVRNHGDLACMSVPPKYLSMADFHRYYSGEREAPVPTVFVGGNHEASNHLLELYYGGWVAKNIYYLGHSGVLRVGASRDGSGGLRVAGLSGIFKDGDYRRGLHERPPFGPSEMRSAYHARAFEVWKLRHLASSRNGESGECGGKVDTFLSHDWPRGIARHGDFERLCRAKKFLADELRSNSLGSPACEDLLYELQPKYWFSAHLHTKFAALVRHPTPPAAPSASLSEPPPPPTPAAAAAAAAAGGSVSGFASAGEGQVTRFLALDKCLRDRDFLQILDIPTSGDSGPSLLAEVPLLGAGADAIADADAGSLAPATEQTAGPSSSPGQLPPAPHIPVTPVTLSYDLEWLAITRLTQKHMPLGRGMWTAPQLYPRSTLDAEIAAVRARMVATAANPNEPFAVPFNFERSAPVYNPQDPRGPPATWSNPQTTAFLQRLELRDVFHPAGPLAPVVQSQVAVAEQSYESFLEGEEQPVVLTTNPEEIEI